LGGAAVLCHQWLPWPVLILAAATQLSESSSVRCQNKSFLRGKDDLVAVPLPKVSEFKSTCMLEINYIKAPLEIETICFEVEPLKINVPIKFVSKL
jgi:hypothetical protein